MQSAKSNQNRQIPEAEWRVLFIEEHIQNSPSLARWDAAEWRVLFIEKHIQNSPSLARWDDAGLLLIHACGLLWLTRFGSRGLAHYSDQIASQHNTQMTCIDMYMHMCIFRQEHVLVGEY